MQDATKHCLNGRNVVAIVNIIDVCGIAAIVYTCSIHTKVIIIAGIFTITPTHQRHLIQLRSTKYYQVCTWFFSVLACLAERAGMAETSET